MRYLFFLVSLIGLITTGCSDSSPTKPVVKESYKLYFYDEGDHRKYYSYDPVESRLDSFWMPYRSIKGVVSPDGKSFWTRTLDRGVVVMSLNEQEVVHEFPPREYLEIEFSPDGRYAAFLGYNLAIVRTSDFEIVYADTTSCYAGQFTRGSNAFYYIYDVIWRIDLEDSFAKEMIDLGEDANRYVRNVLPTGDESTLYLCLEGYYFDYLAVYNPATDSLAVLDALFKSAHQFAFDRNEERLFVSTVYPQIIFEFPPEYIFQVYDTGTLEPIWEQSDRIEMNNGDTIYVYLSDMVITPDYKWLAVIGWDYDGQLVMFDLETMQGVYNFNPGLGHQFWFLSCSSNLN